MYVSFCTYKHIQIFIQTNDVQNEIVLSPNATYRRLASRFLRKGTSTTVTYCSNMKYVNKRKKMYLSSKFHGVLKISDCIFIKNLVLGKIGKRFDFLSFSCV